MDEEVEVGWNNGGGGIGRGRGGSKKTRGGQGGAQGRTFG